jgi:mannitol/fructose-specific phosphotransferase system IIA component (Ntr-type)
MAGKITALLDPARVQLRVNGARRTAALNAVARLLAGHPDVTNFDGFYAELLARDRLDTTCLGNGVALPHARTEHVKDLVLAVGRSDSGVLFEKGGGGETVRLIFMVGTPKARPADYLAVVSALCKLLKSDTTRAALLAAPTPEEFVKAVAEAEDKLLAPA